MINNTRVVAGVTSGGTGELCGAGWDLYTSVHAELDYIDSVMNAAPPPDPNPDPDPNPNPDPNPDPNPSGDDDGDHGGCNAAGGSSALLAFAFAGIVLRRRRRT
jgi:uncharacterized protein (TIGR03382 family)